MMHLRRRFMGGLCLGLLAGRFASASTSEKIKPDNGGTPKKHMEDFSLEYELTETGAGWAQAKVSIGAIAHDMTVSYLTRDPLGLLAHALIGFIWPEEEGTVFVIKKPGQAPFDPKELSTRSFLWEDEPGGVRWTLRPLDKNTVSVKLEEPTSRTEWKILVDSSCSLQAMTKACVNCLESLLQKHGLVGYRLNWSGGDLPITQYLILKGWLQDPQYDAKSMLQNTWHADFMAIKALGG